MKGLMTNTDKYHELDKLAEDSFLQPVVEYGRFFRVDTECGTEYVPAHLIGNLSKPYAYELLDYCEGSKLYDYELIDGWNAYASADGYLDRTESTVFETEQEAVEHLIEFYGE